MKYEDFYKQLNVLKEEERKVTSKIAELEQKYISELPFKTGDKVEVLCDYIKSTPVGWIKGINLNAYKGLDISLYIPKKNGEKSGIYRCIWGVRLEDIKLL